MVDEKKCALCGGTGVIVRKRPKGVHSGPKEVRDPCPCQWHADPARTPETPGA